MIAIQENVSLEHLNTFGLKVNARYFIDITSLEALSELTRHQVFRDQRRLILGGGSNILFTRDFDGLVIRVRLAGKRVVKQTDDHVWLSIGAGEVWHDTVLYCLDQNWGGIENLSLIPGTVGAAPIQNIGAYGVEIQNVLHSVDGVDLSSSTHRSFTREECHFGYRESVFKRDLREIFFISSVTLRLTRNNHRLDTKYGAIQERLAEKKIASPTIRDVSDAVIHIRRSKLPDPAVTGNAGSFFKNPVVSESVAADIRREHPELPSYRSENQLVKIPAGYLIEQCGWKGKSVGRVGVHAHQALVLVNHGGGSGEEILALSKQIQESVKRKFGVELITEVNII